MGDKMKIIRDIKRVNGELPSLEGHTPRCVYGENADGTDALICFCPPVEVAEVKEAKKEVVAPKPAPTKKPESKIETVTIDTDEDGIADTVVVGDVVRGSNKHSTKIDINGDGEADVSVKGTVVSRETK